METLVDESVSTEDLKKAAKLYHEQMQRGNPSAKTKFEYGWCLVRSSSKDEMQKGIKLLEELFHNVSDEAFKRDCLFFIAIGQTRLKNYREALDMLDGILKVQPGNHQTMQLKAYIENKMRKEGLIGMAIVGGAAAVSVAGLGALIGFLVAKKS